MSQKKIAIIGTRGYPSYYGGFETAVRKLAPYLVESGWEVTVYGRPGAVKLDDPERDSRVRSVLTNGVETKSLSTLSYGFFSTLKTLWLKPDVALVMNVANGYFLPLMKLRGIRTVVNVDGIEWERQKWGFLAKTVFKVGAKLTAAFGDVLIYDSIEIAKFWKTKFKREGVYIPYGGETEPKRLPLEDGLKPNSYVLAVARFVPENTIPEFLEAAEKISKSMPVVIVGSSGYGGELDDYAQKLSSKKNITWTGHISDDERLLSLWQNAAVYFHGHSVGGTNPTLVQAMALGVPVVARNTVYNREVLGDGGVFCDPNPLAITSAILDLASDPQKREKISKANSQRAKERFTWSAVNEKYQQTLLNIMDIH